MPFTIEIEPQIEARLREQAATRGVSVEAEAARRLAVSMLTDEEREELEDALDVAAANRAREEDRANPSARKTLDDLCHARAEQKRQRTIEELII